MATEKYPFGLEPGDGRHRLIGEALSCSPELACHIGRLARERRLPARAVIVSAGAATGAAYLILLGRANALLYGIEGQLILLYDFGPGDLFGIFDELESYPEEAEVVAAERVHLLIIDGGDLVRLAETHATLGIALARMLLRRLRQITTRMYERSALSATGRVYAELLRQARRGGDMTIRPIPVIAELAVIASTTRETASRAVSALDRRGIVLRKDDGLAIVAPHRLEEMIV